MRSRTGIKVGSLSWEEKLDADRNKKIHEDAEKEVTIAGYYRIEEGDGLSRGRP